MGLVASCPLHEAWPSQGEQSQQPLFLQAGAAMAAPCSLMWDRARLGLSCFQKQHSAPSWD